MPLPEAAKTFTTGLSPVGKQANRPAGDGDSPFGGWRHHLSPASGSTIELRHAVSCL